MAYKNAEDTLFRDKLAIEGTHMAKERTILAYARTGISLLGLAVLIYRFIDFGNPIINDLILAGVGLPGVFLTFYGLYRVFHTRNERKEFERFTNSAPLDLV
jgi:uncharacterized membrane protein YidH (DUF202 family)